MMNSATADATSREQAELVGLMLERLVPEPAAVTIERNGSRPDQWNVNGLFRTAPSPADLDLIAAASGCGRFGVVELGDDDWVSLAMDSHTPVIAGEFWVVGSHQTGPVPAEMIPVLIDASVAFGTGHHGTTQGCLEAMSGLKRTGFHPETVCDLGCGSGILAIAAAKLWQCQVIAIDNDPCAVSTAIENVQRNDADGLVEVAEGTGLDQDAVRWRDPFDLCLANILADPLIALAPEIAHMTTVEGTVVLSGLLVEEGSQVIDACLSAGLVRVEDIRIDEWLTLVLARRA